MKDSRSSGDFGVTPVHKLRTYLRIIGWLCIVSAILISILTPSVLGYCGEVFCVRLYLLHRFGDIDYEAVTAVSEVDIHDARSLTDWIVDDGLTTAYLAAYVAGAVFVLIGVTSLVLARRITEQTHSR